MQNNTQYYEEFIKKLKTQLLNTNHSDHLEITIIFQNLEDLSEEIIINNTHKKYNWVYLIYDPKGSIDILGESYPQEALYYWAHTFEEMEELFNYLINNSSTWITHLDPEDALEYSLYGKQ